jgi:hypothetical protein
MALVMLVACSKQAPPQPPAEAPAATLQCEQLRTALEAAGKATGGPLMQSDVDGMNKIVGRAMQAGCYHKP